MESADHIIDLGPEAGNKGGEIVAEGTYEQILKNDKSITGRYLSNKSFIPFKEVSLTFSLKRYEESVSTGLISIINAPFAFANTGKLAAG